MILDKKQINIPVESQITMKPSLLLYQSEREQRREDRGHEFQTDQKQHLKK